MSDQTINPPINIQKELIAAYGDHTQGRIFALMGPNGCGKSRLLEAIENQLRTNNLPILRLSAIRTLIPGQATDAAIASVDPITLSALLQKRLDIGRAIFWEVASIFKSVAPREQRFKDVLYEYWKGGKKGPEPTAPINQAKQLQALLKRVLGYDTKIELVTQPPAAPQSPQSATRGVPRIPSTQPQKIQAPKPELKFNNGKFSFDTSGLSDGEKQMVMLAWMLAENRATQFIFLVDEPELYLNEARAIEFWEKIEDHFPAATFLYATHNVVFATRAAVSRTYLMGMDGNVEILASDSPLAASVVREMVGARIQILRTSNPIIFCEDTLLRNIAIAFLPKNRFEFVPLDGAPTVLSAVGKDDKSWAKVRSTYPHCGVIDLDAKDDDDVQALEAKRVFCFPLFEAESLLLLPEIAIPLISKRANREITNEEYKTVLFEAATGAVEKTLSSIAAHLSRSYVDIRYDCASAGVSNVEISPPPHLKEKFEARARKVFESLAAKDAAQIVKLFDGKQLCSRISNKSHAAFGIEFGAHPESDFDYLINTLNAAEIFAGIPYLNSWVTKITNLLSQV